MLAVRVTQLHIVKATEIVSTLRVKPSLIFVIKRLVCVFAAFCTFRVLIEMQRQELKFQRDCAHVIKFPTRVSARETEIAV